MHGHICSHFGVSDINPGLYDIEKDTRMQLVVKNDEAESYFFDSCNVLHA